MKALFGILAALSALAIPAQSQTTVDWDFSGGGGSGAPIPSLPPNMSGGTIAAYNEYLGPPPNNPGFNSANQSSGYTGASGNHNASVGIVYGTLNPVSSTYFQCTITPAGGFQLSATTFQLGSFSNRYGPQTLTLLVSTDNFATSTTLWTATALPNDSNWYLVTGSGSFSYTAPIDTAVTFRLYGSDGIGGDNDSDWRIDDVSLGITASAVPEPPTYAALLLGAALMGVRTWRRRLRRAV